MYMEPSCNSAWANVTVSDNSTFLSVQNWGIDPTIADQRNQFEIISIIVSFTLQASQNDSIKDRSLFLYKGNELVSAPTVLNTTWSSDSFVRRYPQGSDILWGETWTIGDIASVR